jgi:hypothetical protein
MLYQSSYFVISFEVTIVIPYSIDQRLYFAVEIVIVGNNKVIVLEIPVGKLPEAMRLIGGGRIGSGLSHKILIQNPVQTPTMGS